MDPDVVSNLGFDHVIDAGTNPLHAARESSTHRTRDGISIESNRHQRVFAAQCRMQSGTGRCRRDPGLRQWMLHALDTFARKPDCQALRMNLRSQIQAHSNLPFTA